MTLELTSEVVLDVEVEGFTRTVELSCHLLCRGILHILSVNGEDLMANS